MKKILVLLLVLGVGVFLGRSFDGDTNAALATECANQNGDVNGDNMRDIADAVYILNWLFNQGPEPEPICIMGGAALPDTGQTTCYDEAGLVVNCETGDCFGQDGFKATGCPTAGRFVDNMDGTVMDTCSGLMWQQDTGNDGNALNWCSALDYCESLDFAGHTDWRMPNVRELQSIADYQLFDPAIDSLFGALSSFYWSSTSYAEFPAVAWLVVFSFGGGNEGSGRRLARAVRSAP